jgi:hypothetical protein
MPAPFSVFINAGGAEYVDTKGNIWEPDTGYYNSGSNVYTTPSATEEISGTAEDVLYRSERWSAQPLIYEIDVPEAGNYQVSLHFAEIAFSNSGFRVFDVTIEGSQVSDDFDIARDAPGLFKAITIDKTVHVSDGRLTVTCHFKRKDLGD